MVDNVCASTGKAYIKPIIWQFFPKHKGDNREKTAFFTDFFVIAVEVIAILPIVFIKANYFGSGFSNLPYRPAFGHEDFFSD